MNEGDTFGTASGGANQPQFSNSFDRPSGAITSSPEEGVPTVSTASSSNSSKFFGGRSRFSGRSSGGSSQANFAAAQQISSNPNTPQFFSEAVLANNPAPVENESKPKKGLFIGIGAVAVVLIIVLVVALIPKGSGGTDPFAELPTETQEFLSDDTYEEAIAFEEMMIDLSANKVNSIWVMLSKETYEKTNKHYDSYKKFISSVASYDMSKLNKTQKEVFESVKTTSEATSPKFEKIMSAYGLLISGFVDKNESSISKLLSSDNAKLKELAVDINDAFTRYKEYTDQYNANNCSEIESSTCDYIRSERNKTEDLPSAPGQFLDFVKSCNGGKSFTDEDAIYDEILKIKVKDLNTDKQEGAK